MLLLSKKEAPLVRWLEKAAESHPARPLQQERSARKHKPQSYLLDKIEFYPSKACETSERSFFIVKAFSGMEFGIVSTRANMRRGPLAQAESECEP